MSLVWWVGGACWWVGVGGVLDSRARLSEFAICGDDEMKSREGIPKKFGFELRSTMNRLLIVLVLMLSTFGASPALAAKCYGEHECGACKNCNYCKNCNNGGELCGVYYQSRNETPPWKIKHVPKIPVRHKKAA